MAEYLIQDTTLTAIADAIRNKTESTEEIAVVDMAEKIESIETIKDIDINLDYINNYVTEISYRNAYSDSAFLSVSFPKLTKISSSYAFSYCKNLKSVDFPLLQKGYSCCFSSCTSLIECNLPKMASVSDDMFRDCKSLKSISLPAVTSIGISAFYGCNSLSDISIPLVSFISSSAFVGCTSLTKVELPQCSYLGQYVFNGCSNLSAVVFSIEDTYVTIQDLNYLPFNNTPIASGTGFIYVPDNLVNNYKTMSGWSTYANAIKPLSEYTASTA